MRERVCSAQRLACFCSCLRVCGVLCRGSAEVKLSQLIKVSCCRNGVLLVVRVCVWLMY
jgi:hypothetical protein